MARIPGASYSSLPSEQDLGPRPVPNTLRPVVSDQSGEIVGRAIQGAGNTLQQVGNQIQEKQDRYSYGLAASQFQQADIAVRQSLKDDPDFGSYQKRYADAMKKAAADASNLIGNNNDRDTFQLDAQSAIARGLATVQNEARAKEIDTGRATLASSLDSNRVAALQESDPTARQSLIASTQDLIKGAQDRGYVSAQEAQSLQKNWTANYGEGFVKMKPWADQVNLLKKPDGTPAAFIDPEKRVAMQREAENQVRVEQNRAEADLRQKQAELQADMKARLVDTSASYRAGLDVPNAPSFNEIKASSADDYQNIYDSLMKDQRMGADLKLLSTQSPEQIADTVKRYEVKQGGEGAADALMRHGEVLQAAQQSLAERQKDPRGYAIANGLGSKPLDFSDPSAVMSELTTRAATLKETSQRIGFGVQMLSKDEAKQFGALLDSTSYAQRAQWLGALNDKLGDSEAYQSLMRQVLPKSPVSAIVGSKIGFSAPPSPPVWFDHKYLSDPSAPEKILAGEELLNPAKLNQEKTGFKGGFPMPSDGGPVGLKYKFSRYVGDAFRDRPELGDAYYSAFKAAYAGLLAQKGDLKGLGDTTLEEQALQMAVGQVHEFNGKDVIVPEGMDPSRFDGLVKNAVAATAKSAAAPADFEDRIRGYQLRELGGAGSGRYMLVNGNARMTRPDGRGDFIIDLRQQYATK